MRDKWGQHARSVVPEQTLEEDPPLHIEPVPSFDLFKRKELDQFVKIFLVVEELSGRYGQNTYFSFSFFTTLYHYTALDSLFSGLV